MTGPVVDPWIIKPESSVVSVSNGGWLNFQLFYKAPYPAIMVWPRYTQPTEIEFELRGEVLGY